MKQNVRHLLSLMLTLLTVFQLFTSVQALESEDRQEIENQIITAHAQMLPTLDLSSYSITGSELDAIYTDLRNGNRLPWYAESYSYRYQTVTGLVVSLEPQYYDPEIYDYDRYEQEIRRILSETVFPGMRHWQIALSVHDYLAARFRYDETYTYYNAPDLIFRETAVCNAYARLYMDILKRAGLEAVYVTSDAMNHGWNLVKIDGSWYHVDVTWDDPTSDCHGQVRHFYFLLDDAAISDEAHGHHSWIAPHTAGNPDRNSGMFWQQSNSRICYESSAVSYLRIDEGSQHWIYRRDESDGTLTEIASFDAGYLDIGAGSYHYQNYGLSLWNDRLYYSDMEQVYSMNTDGSDKTVIYTHDAETAGTCINGSSVLDGTLFLTFRDADGNRSHKKVSLPTEEPTPEANAERFPIPENTLPIPESTLPIPETLPVSLPEAPSGDPRQFPKIPVRPVFLSVSLCILVILSHSVPRRRSRRRR